MLRLARKELVKARRERSEALARDAAGKAWLATVEGLNAKLVHSGLSPEKLPKTERGRVYMVRRLPREIRDTYALIKGAVHIDAYYENIIDYAELRHHFATINRVFLTAGR